MNYTVEYKYLFELTPPNQNKNRQKISKKKISKQMKNKRSSQKYHWVCFVLTNTWGLSWSVIDITQWHSTGEYLFSLCQSVSITNSFLVKGEILCPIRLLSAGTLSDLNMCRSCMYCHSSWVHICISPVVFGRYCFLGVSQLSLF